MAKSHKELSVNFILFNIQVLFVSLIGFSFLCLPNQGLSNSEVTLKEVLFSVDGIPHSIRKGQVFDVSYGSVLVLKKSILSKTQLRESSMNFIGFPNGSLKRPYDDRNIPIELWKQSNRWAVKKEKNATVYSTKVYYRSLPVGEVYFRLLHPKFEYLELSINGVSKIIRTDSELTLKSTDKIKFGNVKLTPDFLEPKQIDIDFDLGQEGQKPKQQSNLLKIKISHNGRSVGDIPVKLQ